MINVRLGLLNVHYHFVQQKYCFVYTYNAYWKYHFDWTKGFSLLQAVYIELFNLFTIHPDLLKLILLILLKDRIKKLFEY